MRFAVAIAAILTNCLASSANEPTRVQLLPKQLITSNNIEIKARSSRKLIHGEFLMHLKETLHSFHDTRLCDPNEANSFVTDADTGILSECLPGEYCSKDGVCVTDLPGVELRPSAYTVDTVNSFLPLCNGTDPTYTCDCSGLDITTETGAIYCDYLVEKCLGDVCYDASAGFNFYEDLDSYIESYYCKNITKPYLQEICYYFYTGEEECDIYINGLECNSCQFLEGDIGYVDDCLIFDCTNVPNGNAGNSCEGDYTTDAFDGASVFVPVDENVSFLQAILYGISSMSRNDQVEWATLTAEYIVNFYETTVPDLLQELTVLIEVLAVIPNSPRERILQECGGSVNVIYNMFLSYLIQDPTLASPSEIAELPFVSEADQANYTQFLKEFGTGSLDCIEDIELLGQVQPIRPAKGEKRGKKSGKKSSKKGSKKSSKKASKSEKASKSAKKSKSDKHEHKLYVPPPVTYPDEEFYYDFEQIKHGNSEGKGISAEMYGYPEHHRSSKSEKKGKRRRD